MKVIDCACPARWLQSLLSWMFVKAYIKTLNLMLGVRSYLQVLDYINIPFRCASCHRVGHVLDDCDLKFQKRFRKGRDVASEAVDLASNPPIKPKVYPDASVLETKAKVGDPINVQSRGESEVAKDFLVGDISIPLILDS